MNNYNSNQAAMDFINLLSFIIGLKNLDINVSQTDLQEETKVLDKKLDIKIHAALEDIHSHLEKQDQKLDYIIQLLEEEREK